MKEDGKTEGTDQAVKAAQQKAPAIKMQLDPKPELGEGVDFAAAGATDLNNFKGYHN
jgi:hypothetical protein